MLLPANAKSSISAELIECKTRLAAIQKSPQRVLQAVGMIGPGDGGERECTTAYQIAYHLAEAGFAVICGGRGGDGRRLTRCSCRRRDRDWRAA